MDKQTLFRKTGGMEQVLGVRDCVLQGGKAQGTRAVELYNASGLSVTVLPGRGMDISSLKCKGINLSFLSKTGNYRFPIFHRGRRARLFPRLFCRLPDNRRPYLYGGRL